MRRNQPRLRPWQAWALTVTTSVIGGALCTAAGLRARGRAQAARRVALYGLSLGGASFVALCALKLAWYHVAGLFLAVNGLAGLGFAWVLRRWPLRPEPATTEPRGTGWSILWGVLGGSLIASYVGGGLGVAYFLCLDVFFSTLFPSLAGRFTTLIEIAGVLFECSLIGAIVGGILGSKRRDFPLTQVAWAIGGFVLTYFTSRYVGDLLISIPAFQAQKLAGSQWTALLITQVVIGVVRCTASIVGALLLADQAAERPASRWRTIGLLGGVQLASVLTILVYSGRVSYDFLLLGQLLEKQAHLALAQRAYEIGLSQRPDEAISSYLQFQIGLLHRKLGQDQEARTAFSKVVTKYTSSPTLVARAHRFLAAMERIPQGASRYAIQHIETLTEFKGAYCVPNSLSLVLRFWQVPIAARTIGRRITSLDFGTALPDAFWYVQTKGLQHWVLPLAGVEDIKRFLDQRIPLLLYVPRHVLAVFGYDPVLNSLVTYDVAQEDIWVDRPIDELVPGWKGELAPIGIVLPDDRFAQLSAEDQDRLNRFTSAYFHHAIHLPYHHSSDLEDQDRALAHLEAAVSLAPEFFFDLAHIYVRWTWSHRRAALAAQHDLRAIARRGLEFVQHQFANDEVLEELAALLVDLEDDERLYEFLVQQFKEGGLDEREELVRLLGLLAYRRGHLDAAIAYLTTLEGATREPMVLGRALEATKAFQSALNEYASLLELDAFEFDDKDLRDMEGFWFDRVREALQSLMKGRGATPLFVRRRAWERVRVLAGQLQDQEQLRIASGQYVKGFPWDLDAQLAYAESLVVALDRDTSLPAETREQFRRELVRSVSFLHSLDLEQRWQDRLRAFDAFLKTG